VVSVVTEYRSFGRFGLAGYLLRYAAFSDCHHLDSVIARIKLVKVHFHYISREHYAQQLQRAR
jgi:hypothetical protein